MLNTIRRVLEHVKLLDAKRRADERIAEQASIIQGVLDNMDPGVTLFDAELRLAAWNGRLLDLFDIPLSHIAIGMGMTEFLGHMAGLGEFGGDDPEAILGEWVGRFRAGQPFRFDHARPTGRVIEIRGGAMPGEGHIATYTDITERKKMEDELRRLATTDPLTGVNNRRRYTEISEREIARCRRYGQPLSVMMLDADHFKRVNDTYGHDIGDRVLKSLARICRETIRDSDILCRFGGEEFTVTLPDTAPETAAEAAERLRAALAEARVPLDDGVEIQFTVSIGVTSLIDADGGLETLLARADGALYQAKEQGRNRIVAV